MELFANLALGMTVVLTPTNLLSLLAGATTGMMLAAIYYAAMYGGRIASILLNTPGESATVASTFDGYPLAKQGRAGPALVMQAVAGFVGGTLGVVLITVLAPLFALVTRSFGPPEFFLIVM